MVRDALKAAAVICTLAAANATPRGQPLCPPPSAAMAVLEHGRQQLLVCEDFSQLNGSVVFLEVNRLTGATGATVAKLDKRLYSQNTQPTFAGLNMSDANKAADDAIGKALLAAALADGGRSVSYDEVLAALPPIISGWGAKPNFGYAGQHTVCPAAGTLATPHGASLTGHGAPCRSLLAPARRLWTLSSTTRATVGSGPASRGRSLLSQTSSTHRTSARACLVASSRFWCGYLACCSPTARPVATQPQPPLADGR